MHIREEVNIITERIGRPPNNLEQFVYNKYRIVNVKNAYNLLYGYVPTIKECVYILENDLTEPPKCKNDSCMNYAKFIRHEYNYCSRVCSDNDSKRNAKIQSLRSKKIDYDKVHAKVVKTKNVVGSDGLTVHQRSSLKAMQTRIKNYDNWYEATLTGNKEKSFETKVLAAEKRTQTIFEKYGVTHLGGGYSKMKRIKINEIEYTFQGYEDVALYELIIVQGISAFDVECCSRYKQHRFKYSHGFYYPDLFIISQKKYIEVKSEYWDKKDRFKELKRDSVISAGFDYSRIIYDDKATIKEARDYFKEKNCYIKS